MKYAAKMQQKVIPEEMENIGRFWGVSGCRDVMAASTTFDATNINTREGILRFERLFLAVEKVVRERLAWVMHEEKDCMVVIFDNWKDAVKFKNKLLITNALLGKHETMFLDAECDDTFELCL
jgi:hypothetical protein